MTNDKKLGDLADRLSILELRQFMAPRFRGHEVEDDTQQEIDQINAWLKNLFSQSAVDSCKGEIDSLRKLNACIWMLQHVESEVDKAHIGRPGTEAEALTAIGMIHRLVMHANTLRVQAVAKLNGEAVRKVY